MMTTDKSKLLVVGFIWALKELRSHDQELQNEEWIEAIRWKPVPNPIPAVIARFDLFCNEANLPEEEKEQFRTRVFL